MSKPSYFRHYSLSSAKRKTLGVSSFGGVDYSSQRFLVSDGHAIDMKNFIYRDGVMQKRNGVEHLLNVEDFTYGVVKFDNTNELLDNISHTNFTEKQFNGMWRFKAEDGQYHIIAHIGKLLYEIKNFATDYIKAEPIVFGTMVVNGDLREVTFEYENFKSFAFVGGNKLWFLGGNKYMCIRFLENGTRQVIPMEDSDLAPIPTTTISIKYNGALGSDKRESYDNVNLLTMFRKNYMITGVGKNETQETKTTFYEYTLDAPLIVKNVKDMAKISLTLEEIGEKEEV